MGKPIRRDNGQFSGSIGDGGKHTPTAPPTGLPAAPATTGNTPTPLLTVPVPALTTVADLKRRLQPGVTLIPTDHSQASLVGVPRVVTKTRSGGVELDVPSTGNTSFLDFPKAANFTGDPEGRTFTVTFGSRSMTYRVVDPGEDIDAVLAQLPLDQMRADAAQAETDRRTAEAQTSQANYEARQAEAALREAEHEAAFDAEGHLCQDCGQPAHHRSTLSGQHGNQYRCRDCKARHMDEYRAKNAARQAAADAAQSRLDDVMRNVLTDGRRVTVTYARDSLVQVANGNSEEPLSPEPVTGRVAPGTGGAPILIPTGHRTRGYRLHAAGNQTGWCESTVAAVRDADTGEVLYQAD